MEQAADAEHASDLDWLSTYEEMLERWTLHDRSDVTNSPGDAEFKKIFRRWRATRSKPVAVLGNVTAQSLNNAWTAFVERCNTEGADDLMRKLERREADHANLSVSALADQICENSYGADRDCCFVHFP
ncbi:hypothetical protein PHMEG_0006225 [Phytophthora megakarya]|uniref:Uncharacterized protein n=1 Tax=Phytophthora megakarya TaxID=4795 RepID=A0A225WPB7_9STRA|nr:hypothetical protein PHMEG_0006225 [Phytophthora megakarya]